MKLIKLMLLLYTFLKKSISLRDNNFSTQVNAYIKYINRK